MELERRLRALGWLPKGEGSGRNHDVWVHPSVEVKIYVPRYDLIIDAVAWRILQDAEG
jgi:hypothetical protein